MFFGQFFSVLVWRSRIVSATTVSTVNQTEEMQHAAGVFARGGMLEDLRESLPTGRVEASTSLITSNSPSPEYFPLIEIESPGSLERDG